MLPNTEMALKILFHLIGGLGDCIRDYRTLKASGQRNGHLGAGGKRSQRPALSFSLTVLSFTMLSIYSFSCLSPDARSRVGSYV